MASIYMNIEKFEPKGVATIKGPEGVYMAVKSYSWGAWFQRTADQRLQV